MRLKIIYILIFGLSIAQCGFGQHQALLSQYLENALPSNPAFAGSRESMSISASYRNQWLGIKGSPETQLITLHTPLKKESIAFGGVLYRETIGATSQFGVMANAAYRVKFDRYKTLSIGIAGGLFQQRGKWDQINTDQEGDPIFQGGEVSSLLPNFSAGAYYNSKKFFASYSLPFLMSHSYSAGKISARNAVLEYNHLFIVGGEFKLYKKWKIRPSARGHILLNDRSQFDVNVLVHDPKLAGVGISYRYKEALVAMVQLNVNQQFAIIYSYDLGLNALNAYHVGTHELTMRFDLRFVSSAPSPKFF